MSNRKFLLTVVGLLAAIALLLSSAQFLEKKQAVQETIPDRSIYNSKPSGYKAWFTLMERVGRPVKPWQRDFAHLAELPSPATMILVSPKERVPDPKGGLGQRVTLDKKSIERLRDWVAAGNTLIFLDPMTYWAHQDLLVAFNEEKYAKIYQEYRKKYPHGQGAHLLSKGPGDTKNTDSPSVWGGAHGEASQGNDDDPDTGLSPAPGALPNRPLPAPPKLDPKSVQGMFQLAPVEPAKWISKWAPQGIRRFMRGRVYTHAEGPIIISESNESPVLVMPEQNPQTGTRDPVIILKRYGQGLVIMGTTPDIASNVHLFNPRADNYQFFTNLSHLRNQPVYINEFIHGYAENANLLAYYFNTPVGHLLFEAAFALILLFWFSFRRWQPVRETLVQDPPLSMGDFIASMAGLYRKNNATTLALHPQLNRLDQLLRRRYRVDLTATDETLGLVLGSLFADNKQQAQLRQSLRMAMTAVSQQQRLGEKDLMRLSADLVVLQHALEPALKAQTPAEAKEKSAPIVSY